MPRKRKNPDDIKLPPDWYRGKSAYEYRPKGQDKRRRTVAKIDLTATLEKIWQKHLEVTENDPTGTLRWLLSEYQNSMEYAKKAPKTRRDQAKQAKIINEYPIGPNRTFGDIRLSLITPGVIRQYLDSRADDGSAIAGNREKALISRAWNWARERDLVSLANPCKDVQRNPEKPRDRYVTDEEYDVVYRLALSYPKDTLYYRIAIAMELAYLCRFRKAEILTAKRDQVTEDGIDTIRVKNGRDTITGWSDRLRAAIDAALQTHGSIPSIYLLSNGRAGAISEAGFDTAFGRIMTRAVKEHDIERFRFHDLRRKGTTDFEGTADEKQDAGGWNDKSMLKVYDLSKPKTKPTR